MSTIQKDLRLYAQCLWHEGWDRGERYRRLREAAGRIDELEAIVERLPVTADGVRVYAGMVLHSPAGVSFAVLAVYFDGVLLLQHHRDDGIPEGDCKMHSSRLYSTREAAEAAAKETRDA